MADANKFQLVETKRRPVQRATRKDARQFIDPIQAQIREAFTNTSDTEQIAMHFDCTRQSADDVVKAGHDSAIQEHGTRLAAIERRLGMGRAQSSLNRLSLVPQKREIA